MGPGFRIGRLFGIDIAIHPSWIIIFALMTFSLAESWFPVEGWSTATTWTVAFAAALLLFVSVLVHELAHSLVARAQGIPVGGGRTPFMTMVAPWASPISKKSTATKLGVRPNRAMHCCSRSRTVGNAFASVASAMLGWLASPPSDGSTKSWCTR